VAQGSRDAYDLSALESVEQLALEYDAPIGASARAQCAPPCPSAGLDGDDIGSPDGPNERLVEGIIVAARRTGAAGNYVFSLPAALLNNLLGYVNAAEKYHLKIPRLEPGRHNTVYVISIDRADHSAIRIYKFSISPPRTYPVVRLPDHAACTQKRVVLSTHAMGLRPAPGINTNEKGYLFGTSKLIQIISSRTAIMYAEGSGAGQARASAG